MIERGDSVRVAHPLFQEERSGSIPTSPLQLRFHDVSVDKAIELNRLWHSRLPDVIKSNVIRTRELLCFAAEHDDIFYATAIWTTPIARRLNDKNWLELRRLAIAPDAPKNTASRMISWMTRQIYKRLRHIEKLISYQDTEVHSGTIYAASGWTKSVTSKVSGTGWNSRERNKMQTTADKVRWEFDL